MDRAPGPVEDFGRGYAGAQAIIIVYGEPLELDGALGRESLPDSSVACE